MSDPIVPIPGHRGPSSPQESSSGSAPDVAPATRTEATAEAATEASAEAATEASSGPSPTGPMASDPAAVHSGRKVRHVRVSIDNWIKVLVLCNIVAVVVLLTVLVADQLGSKAGHPPQAELSPSPSASSDLMPMGLAHIPTSSACILCHEGGGQGGLKVVPAVAHPLEGWRQCTACHTNDKLGRKAPGHDGIAEAECVNCHKVAQAGPAITQPHSRLQDQRCLDCHGSFAHLPTSMASRDEDSCTLCHKPTPLPPPEYPHPANEPLTCRECHQSAEVGNMPIDHALRANETCLLCHDIKRTLASPGASGLPTPGSLSTPGPVVSPSPGASASAAGG